MYYFVDLDGTLKTDRDYRGGEILTLGNNRYGYIVRPHALEFLQGLAELGHVFICTLSSFRYATFFVDKIGAAKYVEEIYSRERLEDMPAVPSYVLIDNDASMAKGKAALIEKKGFALKSEIVNIPTYSGNDDDTELLKILDELKKTKLAL